MDCHDSASQNLAMTSDLRKDSSLREIDSSNSVESISRQSILVIRESKVNLLTLGESKCKCLSIQFWGTYVFCLLDSCDLDGYFALRVDSRNDGKGRANRKKFVIARESAGFSWQSIRETLRVWRITDLQ